MYKFKILTKTDMQGILPDMHKNPIIFLPIKKNKFLHALQFSMARLLNGLSETLRFSIFLLYLPFLIFFFSLLQFYSCSSP